MQHRLLDARPLRALALGLAVLCLASVLSASVRAENASADWRVIENSGKTLNSSVAVDTARGWLGGARALRPTCIVNWADDVIGLPQPATWFLKWGVGGDPCAIAQTWSAIGGSLAYWAFRTPRTRYGIYTIRNYRTVLRDQCKTWVYVYNRWIGPFEHNAPCFGQ
jgi:hypothetical protein